MKSVLLFLLFAFLSSPASSQIRVGLEGGVLVNKITLKESSAAPGFSTTMASTIGYRAGVLADLGLGDHIAVQPGIFYCARGGKLKADFGIFGTSQSDVTVNYLEVPVLVLYKLQVGPGRVFVGLGPSVSMALSGKTHATSSFSSIFGQVDTTIKMEFGSDTSEMKRLDLAAIFNAGYELDMGLFVRVGYYLGLANLSNNSSTADDKMKNRAFQITLGYLLGRRNDY